MKTSAAASLLFAVSALAAPFQLEKRGTSTTVTVKTQWVTVTQWVDDAAPTGVAGGAFYEDHKKHDGYDKPGKPPVTPTPGPPVVPSSVSAPSAVAPSSTVVNSPPAQPTYQPAPEPSSSKPPVVVPVPTPNPSPTYAPQPTQPSNPGSGEVHSGGSLTWHPFSSGTGACSSKPILDTDMAVALDINLFESMGPDVWEQSDVNGNGIQENQQYWCGKMIDITAANGKKATAEIRDKCSGCTNGGVDASKAVFEQLGYSAAAGGRYTASWKIVG